MPPRYAYWTILIGDEPTAFRSGSQEELMPTLKRLQQRQAGARMMWWQNGKLWNSRLDAQEAMRARGEMGRRGDQRQAGSGFRDRERAPRSTERRSSARSGHGEARGPSGKLDWKPKGAGEARPRRPEWTPKASTTPRGKLEWQPKSQDSGSISRDTKPPAKRKWVPKEEYQKSKGIEAKRDKNWRPGGQHKDPRQKYKDAKKAKWGRFKQTIRKRWESKTGKKNDK